MKVKGDSRGGNKKGESRREEEGEREREVRGGEEEGGGVVRVRSTQGNIGRAWSRSAGTPRRQRARCITSPRLHLHGKNRPV